MSDLRALVRRRGMAVFVDVRGLAKAVRARVPLATARRQAEYVLIDGERIALGFDATWFLERHLARVQSVRDGLGYSAQPRSNHARPLASLHGSPLHHDHVPLDARLALRGHAEVAS